MPITPALGLRQEDHKFEIGLDYLVKFCSNNNNKQNKEKQLGTGGLWLTPVILAT
jgi:hypothetical protein